jgi:Rrf2 family protein
VISRSSEYAIRALTFLATESDGRHHLARDMAERLGIPAPFLGKVLQPLVTKKLLHSQRGRSNDFKLARTADQIRLVEIVEAEETLHPADTCVLGQSECRDEGACPLHEYWKATANAYHAKLRGTTLADLVEYRRRHPSCIYPEQDLTKLQQVREQRRATPDAVPA